MSDAERIAAQRAGRSSVRAAISRLSGYVARNRAYYALWSIITLGYVATFLILPKLTGRTVGVIEGGAPADVIVRLAVWLAGIGVLSGVLRYYSRVLVFNAARQIEYELRNDLFTHLQRLPQSFFLTWRTGDLMSRCVNDINSVRMLLGPGLLSVVQTPLLYAGALGLMFWMDWQLALLVLIPYPLFMHFARTFGRGLHRWNIEVQEGLGELSNQLQETISGIAVVKTHAMEGITRGRFGKSNEDLYRKQMKLARVNGAMPAIIGLLPGFAMLIILWVGGAKILAGRMTTEEFITFAMLIYGLTFPTFILGWVFSLLQRGAAAMQRIDEVLTIEPSIADRPDAVEVEGLRGEIEFRDLTFRYSSSAREPALRDLSLAIPAGTTLGIVGPVGSGKTTLSAVIPRLLEVDDGHVFIDGIDVNRLKLGTLRSNIAMVPQDSFLFSMTLAENIAYGLPEVDPKRVAQAVERFGGIDILIVNAGVGAYGSFLDIDPAHAEEIIDTNVKGAIYSVRAALPMLLQSSTADIVMVASEAGRRGFPNEAVYCASKFAQVGLMASLDNELRERGVRCTSICPGGVATDFAMGRGRTPDMPQLAGMMRPEDVAEAVLFAITRPRNHRILEVAFRPTTEASWG